jgi:hypothetical protein
LFCLVVVAGLFASSVGTVRAGGGPENLFLVVNARSWASITVANHYVQLRKIPISNVYYLDWPHENEQIDGETLRTKLLGPVLEEIGRRRIGDHIDYVVYSTDFPWAVDFSAELKGANVSKYLEPTASLNGATFLYQTVLAKRYDFLTLEANKYFRAKTNGGAPSSHAFRAWYGWGTDGGLLEAGGERYLLSTLLGITTGRGMAPSEVVRNLTRSVGADFTRPAGTIYFARNDDIRSKTRHDLFPAAVEALSTSGVRGEVVEGAAPQGKRDVAGAVLGTVEFSWNASRSTIVPGAVCEHLTSSGGSMYATAGQTPLTESLAAGAAGSSGAVVEPYAIAQKFPSPFLHVHYARGCSLAEAFYQSVAGPYQLLIVGDPLCRPWADPPRVSLAGVEAGATVTGTVSLEPSAKLPSGTDVARFEFYVDGVLTETCRGGATAKLETRAFADGDHELRVMAVGTAPIETRGGLLVPLKFNNHGRSLVLERVDAEPVRWGVPLKLRVRTDEAIGIVIAQGSRTLARVRGNEGEVSLDPRTLGLGPVVLQAASLGKAGTTGNALSAPLELTVAPGTPSEFDVPRGSQFKPGMKLTQDDGEPQVLQDMVPHRWLEDSGVKAGESFALSGLFSVDRDGEFQFQLRHAMKATLLVDDVVVYTAENKERAVDYAAAVLRRGLHKVELRGTATDDRHCDIRFGFAGLQRLQPAAMTHIP